jgi:hypothetical protein
MDQLALQTKMRYPRRKFRKSRHEILRDLVMSDDTIAEYF